MWCIDSEDGTTTYCDALTLNDSWISRHLDKDGNVLSVTHEYVGIMTGLVNILISKVSPATGTVAGTITVGPVEAEKMGYTATDFAYREAHPSLIEGEEAVPLADGSWIGLWPESLFTNVNHIIVINAAFDAISEGCKYTSADPTKVHWYATLPPAVQSASGEVVFAHHSVDGATVRVGVVAAGGAAISFQKDLTYQNANYTALFIKYFPMVARLNSKYLAVNGISLGLTEDSLASCESITVTDLFNGHTIDTAMADLTKLFGVIDPFLYCQNNIIGA